MSDWFENNFLTTMNTWKLAQLFSGFFLQNSKLSLYLNILNNNSFKMKLKNMTCFTESSQITIIFIS